MANDLSKKVVELYKQGKHEEVQEILKEAAAVNPQTSEDYVKRSAALSLLGRYEEALKALDGICNPSGIEPFPSYSYYLSRAGVLACLQRYDQALDAIAEGMKTTEKEKGCIPCFVGNCWRVPYFEPLRKPPYLERFEGIVGSTPNT